MDLECQCGCSDGPLVVLTMLHCAEGVDCEVPSEPVVSTARDSGCRAAYVDGLSISTGS